MRAFRAWPRWKPAAPAEAWIHRIAINVSISHRRQQRLHEIGEVIRRFGTPQPGVDPADSTEATALHKALQRLPAKQAATLVLRHHHGYSNREIGYALNISESTVASRLAAAKRHLAALLRIEDRDMDTPTGPSVVTVHPRSQREFSVTDHIDRMLQRSLDEGFEEMRTTTPLPAPRYAPVASRHGSFRRACVSGFRSFLARTCSWGCRWSPSLRQVSERRPSSPDRRTHSYGPITARRSPLPAHRKATVTGTDPLDRSPRRAHTAPNPRTTTAILARDLMTLRRNRRRTRAATTTRRGR